MKLKVTHVLPLLLFGSALVSTAQAQTPRKISYQGTLTQPDGTPLTTGSYSLTFKIYDQSSGGTPIFTETQNVQVANGYFGVEIGGSSPNGLPASLTFDRPYFLGVSVGSGAELEGRTQFTATPYAFRAINADSARFLAAGAIGAENLRDGSISPGKIDASGTTNGQILVSNGSGVSWQNPSTVAVTSLNNQKGALTLVAGPNTTVSTSGSQIIIGSASGIASIGSADNAIVVLNSSGPNVSIGIAANSIDSFQLAPKGISTSKLADGAVTDAKVANGISYSKLTGAPTSLPPNGPAGGDLAGTYPNPAIAPNAVTSAKIADGTIVNADVDPAAAIAYSKLMLTNSIVSADLTASSVTTAKLADSSVIGVKIGTAAVNTAHIADSNVTTPKLADGSVVSAKIADGTIANVDVAAGAAIAYTKLNLVNSIVTGDLVDGLITTAKIADGSITSAKITDGTITNTDVDPAAAIAYSKLNLANSIVAADLTTGSVTGPKIAADAVTTSKIADNAVQSSDLKDGDVQTIDLADGSVNSAKILDGAIVNADVSAAAAIAYSKLTLTNSIVTADLTASSVTTAKLADSSVIGVKIGTAAVNTAHIADANVTTAKIADAAVTSLKIADGSITNADVNVAAGIVYSKLVLTNSIVTSDLTNGSVTTAKLADSAVSGLKLGTAAVNTAHVADGAITDAKVANGISYSKLSGTPTSLPPNGAAGGDLTGTYPNPTVAASAITSAKIADGSIVDADVSPIAAIAYSKLALTNSIQNSDIVANAITTSKVANGTVTTSKMADSAISGLKLLTAAVNTAHIADGAITDAKVANGISYSKLSGAPTSLPPSGAAGGDLTGTYPNPTVAASAITSAKIADGTIINADVSASAAIAYSKLNLSGSVQGSDIAAGTFTTTNSHRAIGNNDNSARELRMLEPSGSGVNYTAFKAQAQAADVTYTLPNAAPTAASQVLQVQAVAGNNATLSWGSIGGGAILFARTGVTANAGNTSYNVQTADDIIGIDMSAGTNFTVNLQPATTAGEILIIKIEKYNNALLPVLTIAPNGTDKIDGANNLAFGNAGGVRRLYSDGAGNWYGW